MTRYHVDSEQVLLASIQARTTIAQIHSDVQTLNSQLQSLQSSWNGPAASAFVSVHAAWQAAQIRVEESLHSLSESLSHAGRHYQEMEAANARLFQR